MKWKYILILVLAFSLGACKKITHTDTSIKGKVINQTDNTPLVGYSVYLQERETPFSATEPPVSTTLDSRTTDSNGEFDFGEWELKKRSKFRYYVVFDNNEEHFKTNRWQSGDYVVVNTEEELVKGESNSLTLLQVKAGNYQLIVSNNSVYSILKFEVEISNDLNKNASGLFEVQSGEKYRFNTYVPFASGKVLFEYSIEEVGGNFKDTVYQEAFIPHNENTDIYYTYPPQ